MTFDELMAVEPGNQAVYDELLGRCRKNCVVPFCGAGMSRWAGYPMWGELLKEMCEDDVDLKNRVQAHLEKYEYEQVADEIEHAYEQAADEIEHASTFRRMLSNRFEKVEVNEGKRPAYQESLKKIFTGTWLTTNYDRLIEGLLGDGLSVFDPSNSYDDFQKASKLQSKELVLLKLHGRIESPKSIVLTTADYQRAYGSDPVHPDLTRAMPKCLDEVFAGNSALFLGASLQQDRTVKMVTSYCANQGLTHYAVMALPVREKLEDWGIRTIWIPEGKYDEAYAALFDRLALDCGRGDSDDGQFSPVHKLLGREAELESVATHWKKCGTPAPLVWVSGVGGIGKTEFCKAVCTELIKESRRRVFVPLQGVTSVEGLYGIVLKTLGHDPTMVKASELAGKAADLLAKTCSGGVVYFDNAEDLYQATKETDEIKVLAEWLAGMRGRGVGIVVSCRNDLPDAALGFGIKLKTLGPEQSKQLFNAVFGRGPDSDEQEDYEKLLTNLGGYPLAIVLVAQLAHSRGYIDLEGWESAHAKVLRGNSKHIGLDVALASTWTAISDEPQAVKIWGLLYWSVVPLKREMLAELLGEKPIQGLTRLNPVGLVSRDANGAFSMLNPIREQFPVLAGEETARQTLDCWCRYLKGLLPRADQTDVPKEDRVSDEDELAANRVVLSMLPQVRHILDVLCERGETESLSELMYLARNFFQCDVGSVSTLQSLCRFFEGKPDRKKDLALANEYLGDVQKLRGESEAADQSYHDALAIYKKIDNRRGQANVLSSLGDMLRLRGESDAAEQSYRDALTIYEEIGDRLGLANAQLGLGRVQQARGESDAAEKLYRAAQAIYEEIGNRLGLANVLDLLGDVQMLRDEFKSAEKLYREALAIYKKIGNKTGIANAQRDLERVRQKCGS